MAARWFCDPGDLFTLYGRGGGGGSSSVGNGLAKNVFLKQERIIAHTQIQDTKHIFVLLFFISVS